MPSPGRVGVTKSLHVLRVWQLYRLYTTRSHILYRPVSDDSCPPVLGDTDYTVCSGLGFGWYTQTYS